MLALPDGQTQAYIYTSCRRTYLYWRILYPRVNDVGPKEGEAKTAARAWARKAAYHTVSREQTVLSELPSEIWELAAAPYVGTQRVTSQKGP